MTTYPNKLPHTSDTWLIDMSELPFFIRDRNADIAGRLAQLFTAVSLERPGLLCHVEIATGPVDLYPFVLRSFEQVGGVPSRLVVRQGMSRFLSAFDYGGLPHLLILDKHGFGISHGMQRAAEQTVGQLIDQIVSAHRQLRGHRPTAYLDDLQHCLPGIVGPTGVQYASPHDLGGWGTRNGFYLGTPANLPPSPSRRGAGGEAGS